MSTELVKEREAAAPRVFRDKNSRVPLTLQGLARIFHTHEKFFQRNIRPLFERSDFVAADPDEVGPTGRTFHTSECEMFGLDPANRRYLENIFREIAIQLL